MTDEVVYPLDSTTLNRHFIQLISCGDDYQFQELIKTFIPVLIRSIEIQTDDFRKKALEIFIHVNKRVKSRPEIQIPVRSLLEIFTTSTQCSPFSSNFSIMYIKMGFMRLKSDIQVELIPLLFQSLPNRTTSHQELLMGLIVYALQHVRIIPNMQENIVKYGLVDQPTIRHLFLNFLLNVLLLSYKFDETKSRTVPSTHQSRVEPSQAPVDEILFSTMEDAPSKDIEVFKQPFPCMNQSLYNRITEAIQTDDLDEVEKLKVGILKFLNGNIYSENEIIFHFVLSTADARYSVVLAAEHDIKRLTVAVDWNLMAHVRSLFEFFLGTSKTVKQQGEHSDELIRNPSNTRIRLKLYPYLLKSRTASTIFPHSIQILYESLFGNSTNARIKYFSLQFAQNIIQNAESDQLIAVSKLLLNALEKVLNTETHKTHDSSRLRSLTYVLIGKLSYRVPKLFAEDIRLTQQFFEALKTEDNECCLNIQEALTLLAYSQKDASIASKHMLQQLLTQQVIPNPSSDAIPVDYPNCRQAAVSYVMNVFPSNDCTSRFILLTACSDRNEDIRSLANRNLFVDQDENYPEFQSLLKLILSNAHGDYPMGKQTLVYHPQTYQEMIYYLHRCLIRQSFNGEKNTPLWKYEEQLAQIAQVAQQSPKIWYNYIQFLLDFVLVVHNCLSTYFLLEAILIGHHLNDSDIQTLIRDNLSSFRQLSLFCTRDDTRRYASILYAYVLSKKLDNLPAIDELIKIIPNANQRFEQREASILVLGYVCSYLRDSNEYINHGKDILLRMFFENFNEYSLALLTSIGQIARMKCFTSRDENQLKLFIEKVKTKIRTINETNRLKEKAIQTLGFLAVCYREQSESIIEILTQSLVDTKQIELQLNIGDALICCLLGVDTPLVDDPYLILDCKPQSSSYQLTSNEHELRHHLIKYLLERILHYSSDVDNPHSRQAAFIWLLTFLIHCRRPYLQQTYRTLFESKLFHLQTNLIYGLLDQDELNQELGCKCLIYMYEILEDEDIKLKFNAKLFEHFTDSTRSFASQQTTIAYEHNVQQTTIDNAQIALYKELCSLMDLLNIGKNEKSQLFYSFLYLAHENSIWSTTRYGQLFHLDNYEKKSIEFILIYIEQLISRLYRLLYDPQVRIQQCIERIWKKLFASTKQILIVEKYFSLIFHELYTDMLSSRWRIRESIQLAFLDIFRMLNRKLIDNQQYIELFQELFRRLLAVCDDTKESVRKAALTSINSFKQNCLLLACDPATTISNSMNESEHKARGRYVLEQVLPVLLNDGLYNKNEDIAKFSLNTIIEIIRYGNRETLKPYCTVIIIALFEALSSIEPDIFNYASMKLSAAEMKEQIDVARLLCARSSPLMDAINTCTNQYVDEDILDDLSAKLIEAIKHSIGLTTKCLIGQYFITLANLYPANCSKYVGKWMAVLVNTMSANSNRTLRKTYTSVLGTIVRIAKHSSIENLLQKISTWYYQTDGDYQYVCALTLNSISQSNHDLLMEYGQQILPLIYLAMQEKSLVNKVEDEQQEELIWKSLWIEHTGSSITGIQMYMKGIIENIRLAIEHSSYGMKIKGARAIQMIGETLKNNLDQESLNILVEYLLKGLYGRVYEGKECFLRAIETICTHCKDVFKILPDLIRRIYEQILKECKKESLTYRSVAIRVLSLLADQYHFHVYELFWTWFEKALKQPDPNEEMEDDNDDPGLSDAYKRTLIECLPRFWPKTPEIEIQYKKSTFDLLVEIIFHSNWQFQLIVIQSVNQILQNSSTLNSSDIVSIIEPIVNLGPRTKSSGLKREILRFLQILFGNSRYSTCITEHEHLQKVLQFNIDEMIHDNRSSEISEQAKEIKKSNEHFFLKPIKHDEDIPPPSTDHTDLF
ncbi:unnamed protein product [Adineta ricciae]|uniref:Uncharacterized protein n=1 Tax=Adineta ricciae TaxID=249248 RepID=A0A815F7S2_ADIRI|nr:unnamed protein product [Adineta ricciae]CAF1322641.1 unnamed protein product [Adineta ricciae]